MSLLDGRMGCEVDGCVLFEMLEERFVATIRVWLCAMCKRKNGELRTRSS